MGVCVGNVGDLSPSCCLFRGPDWTAHLVFIVAEPTLAERSKKLACTRQGGRDDMNKKK